MLSVKRTAGLFNSVACDLALEQSQIHSSAVTDGLIGITQNEDAMQSGRPAGLYTKRPGTKLSKIKTLRLATSYIGYLMTVLESDDPGAGEMGFRAELVHSGGGRRATVDRPTMDRRTTADNSMFTQPRVGASSSITNEIYLLITCSLASLATQSLARSLARFSPDQDLMLDLPVLGSLAQHDYALANYSTEIITVLPTKNTTRNGVHADYSVKPVWSGFSVMARSVLESRPSSLIHPTEIRTSISPSSVVELNTTRALANYATEVGCTCKITELYDFDYTGYHR
uniref:BHLH domain-containing protein n=1 Tax=Timema bartmani TaxID=61472 RepID=A0A7R9F555_9NEOP|nr:unnamed protein product [Timema bartmani]